MRIPHRQAHVLLAALLFSANAGAETPVTIVMYGDSTTWGKTLLHGAYSQSPTNEPGELQRMFDEAGEHVVVKNRGVSGLSCLDFLQGKPFHGLDAWDVEMKRSNADIVVMNVGINDVLLRPGAGISDCYARLSAIAKANGKIFVIETPNPVAYFWNARVGRVAAQGRDAGLVVIDQWTAIQKIPNWRSMLSDGVHPDAALYQRKAAISFPTLDGIVKSVTKTR